MEPFSRNNPSARYLQLVEQYREMHKGYKTDKGSALDERHAYPGIGLTPFVDTIGDAIFKNACKTLLDYGSGKGILYQQASLASVWGVEATLYDVAVFPDEWRINQCYDIVISTDVLEHCSYTDLPWIIGEMFSLANKIVWLNVACYKASALMPDGANAHETIRQPDWWHGLVHGIASQYPDVRYHLNCSVLQDEDGTLYESK